MSDLSRHLPLSQRGRSDESGVTGDRRPETDAAITLVLGLLESLAPDDWSATTQRAEWTVREVAAHLAWRLSTPRMTRIRDYAMLAASGPILPNDAAHALASRSTLDPGSIVALLRSALVRTEKRPLADLAEIVIGGYDLARSTGRSVTFASGSTGAVALARSLSAPTPIKGVIRSRSLVAVDAGWTVGYGSELRSHAEDIVLFLVGRTTTAPPERPDPHGQGDGISPGATTPDA